MDARVGSNFRDKQQVLLIRLRASPHNGPSDSSVLTRPVSATNQKRVDVAEHWCSLAVTARRRCRSGPLLSGESDRAHRTERAIAHELAAYCWEIASCPATSPTPKPTSTTRNRLTNSR
jgi:hypothetical protein